MYIKYVVGQRYGNDVDEHNYGQMMNDIVKVIDGVYTNASQFNDTWGDAAASQIVGTIPNRADLYEIVAQSASTDRAWRTIHKTHHSKLLSSDPSYNPLIKIETYNNNIQYGSCSSGGYKGFGIKMCCSDGSNSAYPFATTDGFSSHSHCTGVNLLKVFVGQVFHFFITDKIFIMSTTDESDQSFIFGTLEQEYSAGHDEALYNINPLWCSTIQIKSRFTNLEKDEVGGIGKIGMYKAQYVDQNGLSGNSPSYSYHGIQTNGDWGLPNYDYDYLLNEQFYSSESFISRAAIFGADSLDGNNLYHHVATPSLFPTPGVGMPSQSADAGADAHKLHPVYYIPSQKCHSTSPVSGDTQFDTKYGKIEDFYRTTDSVLHTGDVLTDGTNNFRILRLHNIGEPRPNISSLFAACYAIPE
jgi:hypothetical protein